MSAVLGGSGYNTVELPELESWQPGRHGRAVVAAVHTGEALDELRSFSEDHPAVPVVAVVAELTVSSLAAAVGAGAAAVVADDEHPETFVAALQSAFSGWSPVPLSLLRSLAARIPDAPDPAAWVTDDEARWLVELASGLTVADLATRVGYSEREMFRMLSETYARIGVKNRTEAIIWATRHALLDEESPQVD
jgi:DNA-binding NarL/FixJ family response regulator